jgi:hypothetical protein
VIRNARPWSLVLAGILALAAFNIGCFFVVFVPYGLRGYSDFAVLYTAGKIVNDGAAPRLYEPAKQCEIQQQFCDVPIRKGPLLFNHAPFEALLFVPFAWFHYRTAFVLWTCINVVILLLIGFLLRRYLAGLLPHWALLPCVAIASFPCFMVFVQGQDSLLLTLIYTCVFLAMKAGSPFTAGACLALGSFKPNLVLPFVLTLVLRKQWRSVLGFVSAVSILILISVSLMGPLPAAGYVKFLLDYNALPVDVSAAHPASMANLRGLVALFVDPVASHRLTIALVICFSALAVWAAAQAREGSLERTFGLGIAATLLASYHMYAYDLTLLLLPVILMAAQLIIQKRIWGALFFAAIMPWFLSILFLSLSSRISATISAFLVISFAAILWFAKSQMPKLEKDSHRLH